MYPSTMHLRPCAGVCCDVHQRCVRYQHVDGTTVPSAYWLMTCAPPGARDYPAFVDVDFVGPPPPDQYRVTRRDIATLRELRNAARMSVAVVPV